MSADDDDNDDESLNESGDEDPLSNFYKVWNSRLDFVLKTIAVGSLILSSVTSALSKIAALLAKLFLT